MLRRIDLPLPGTPPLVNLANPTCTPAALPALNVWQRGL